MEQSPIEYMEEKLKGDKIFSLDVIINKAKEMEAKQKSRERSIGYSNGYEAALKAFKPDVNINEH
jgi:hypothetical protein